MRETRGAKVDCANNDEETQQTRRWLIPESARNERNEAIKKRSHANKNQCKNATFFFNDANARGNDFHEVYLEKQLWTS